MKHLRSLVSVLMISVLVISFTGCLGGKGFGPQELAAYADKEGAECYKDPDDWNDAYIDSYGDKDGIYIDSTEDIDSIVENYFYLNGANPFEVTCYSIRYDDISFYAASMNFRDPNNAEWYFDSLAESAQTGKSELKDFCFKKTESNATKTISVIYCWGDKGLYVCCGYYYNYAEYNILRFECIGNKKDVVKIVEEFCQEFDLDSPAELGE